MASFSRNRRIVATTTVEESVLSAPSASESPGVRAPGGSARHCAVPFSSAFNSRRVAAERIVVERRDQHRKAGGVARRERSEVTGTSDVDQQRAVGHRVLGVQTHDGANNTAQRLGRGVVTVVPVTSNTARVYPFQVLLPAAAVGLALDSKAQAEQVRSVSVERIGSRVGLLTTDLQTDLDEALRIHLAL